MCASILHNSTDVELQGELPADSAERTLTGLRRMQNLSPGTAKEFYHTCRSTFRSETEGRPIHRRNARWFGHKTPRHEQWFDVYETLFDNPSARPKYVYCLRNPLNVWRSYRVMPWASIRRARDFIRLWIQSVQTFEHMREAAPDRVLLFKLDDFTAEVDRLAWLEATMLNDLGIQVDTFVRPIDALKNTNSAKNKFDFVPPEPPASDVRLILRNREARRILSAYFPGVGVQ